MNQIKKAIRSVVRPVAALGRTLLEPTSQPVTLQWCSIESGPAKDCQLRLPVPSLMTDKICSGNYELICTRVMESLVKPDSVCVDIGGHYGYLTCVLACLARDGAIHTFEPVPPLALRIEEAAARSGLTHVSVYATAVADAEQDMTLRYTDGLDHDSMAYVEGFGGIDTEAAREHYPEFKSVTVPVVRLDMYRDLHADFIKIDAEGAEAAVLRGGLKTLTGAKVRVLVEVHGIQEALDCANLLQTIGYRAVPLAPQNTTMPVLWIAGDDDQAIEAVAQVLGHTPRVLFQT